MKQEDNNTMAEASPVGTKPMQGGGFTAKGITEGVVWWKKEKSIFLISCQDHFWEVLYWESIFTQNRKPAKST